jgi:hypothetical protein
MRKPGLVMLFLVFISNTYCDEGMWLLPLIEKLNIKDMQKKGCKLDAEDIYDINSSSLKDAVAIFADMCTSEMISDKGLMLTNHHCGIDFIHEHSDIDHNYLKEGYWAGSRDEELPNPDLSVKFLEKMVDVTDEILVQLSDTMTEKERLDKINAVCFNLEQQAETELWHVADVESFFGGNRFYLSLYKEYKDVRLVGAPPMSIGKFGGDIDNWMWPRHTGDFCLFRVYTDQEGNPAEYSDDNIPFKSQAYFPVSIAGIEEGDFAMVLGFPGSTNRYMTSYEIEQLLNIIHKNRIKIRGLRQSILKKQMKKNDTIELKYATKYSRSSNYYKYSIGQSRCIKEEALISRQLMHEKEFVKWADKTAPYYYALDTIRKGVAQLAPYRHVLQYTDEAFYRSVEIIDLASQLEGFYSLLKNDSVKQEDLDTWILAFEEDEIEFFENYDKETDKKVANAMFELFKENVEPAYYPSIYNRIDSLYEGINDFVDSMYAKSLFVSQPRLDSFFAAPDSTILLKDPAYQVFLSLDRLLGGIKDSYYDSRRKISKAKRWYIDGLLNMKKGHTFYPNANFTMRMTYGTVKGYYPRDAVYYEYQTTLKGVMEKKDTCESDYTVPEKLELLYEKQDFAKYDNASGKQPVCFITNNDITGGNSGSPIINAKGELIGTAFDGNWESMCGDIQYDPAVQRCIGVDARYMLFIIDQYAEADYLLKELKIKK